MSQKTNTNDIAEALFVAIAQQAVVPHGPSATSLAQQCFRAAEAFVAVREERKSAEASAA